MDKKMASEAMNNSAEEEKKQLTRKVVVAQHDLRQTRNRRKRQRIKEHIDELNMNLGYTFLDLREYKKALAVFSMLSYTTHGEMKFQRDGLGVDGDGTL